MRVTLSFGASVAEHLLHDYQPQDASTMITQHSTHGSYWLHGHKLEFQFPKLTQTHRTEIAVLGGGITGLSVALELLQRGHKVCVIEALAIGGGTTGASTGHLDAHPEQGPARLISSAGLETAREIVRYRLNAIDVIQQRANGACDMKRVPAYQYSDDGSDTAGLPGPQAATESRMRENCEAASQIGLAVEWQEKVPLPRSSFGYRIDNMGRLNSLAYAQHLARLVIQHGGVIFENSIASGALGKEPTEIEAGDGRIQFDQVVCAVHCNYTEVMRTYFQTPAYQSYAVAVRVANPPDDALFWDCTEPYYYTRRANSFQSELLIVGGCDKRTGAHEAQPCLEALQSYIRARYQVKEVIGQWSGELFEPADGLPIIGQVADKENVWIATGLSGVGLTWGTVAGQMIAEQICGRETPLDKILSPARWALSSLPTMIAEQATAAADFSERLLPAARFDPESLQPGEGRVGVVDGKHVAACRDHRGCLHQHSAICTHMGGVVHWNDVEETWDCPVHGGRFRADGTRLYGPPEDDLE